MGGGGGGGRPREKVHKETKAESVRVHVLL